MTMIAQPMTSEPSPAITNPVRNFVSSAMTKVRENKVVRRLTDVHSIRHSRRLRINESPEQNEREADTSLHSSDIRPVDKDEVVTWDAFKTKRQVPAFMQQQAVSKGGQGRPRRRGAFSTTPSPRSLPVLHEDGESGSSADDVQSGGSSCAADNSQPESMTTKSDKGKAPERGSLSGPSGTYQTEICYFCGEPFGRVKPTASREYAAYLYCGHVFGHQCLKRYIKNQFVGQGIRSENCPLCPTPLTHRCGHVTIPLLEAPSSSERRQPGYFDIYEYCGVRQTLSALIDGEELGALQLRTPKLKAFLPPEPSSGTRELPHSLLRPHSPEMYKYWLHRMMDFDERA
ncbi:hypothetical protein CP532_0335 [Ophiocordyceps camponoti-leonardi (nom. inval.)]|nr:hypothetical protein CP532_0335 [Ophiocordyceps camponoti-leonardi (nom. inval.)]